MKMSQLRPPLFLQDGGKLHKIWRDRSLRPQENRMKHDQGMDHWIMKNDSSAVDGRNPAPADMVNLQSFTGFYTYKVVRDLFLPSTV